MKYAAVFLALAAVAHGQTPEPVALPARPDPNWSWETLPIAFHGANRSGTYTDQAVAQLSRYLMVTLEKWYTPCGAQGPVQAGPECDVEAKMFATFRQLKALNPKITNVMYWNSMFDFAFYAKHQAMLDLEAQGQHMFLRDKAGHVAELCNDGNVYCNITTFDHTQPAVRALWFAQVKNAVVNGSVDGVFADHAYNNPEPVAKEPGTSQLCNGKGAGRSCFTFTKAFGERFVAAHNEMLNFTQDWLSKTTKGPVICGPYSRWHVGTDFPSLRATTQKALQDPTAPFAIEASVGACDLAADEAKLAGFLCAMEQYTYLACFHSGPDMPTWYPAYDKPLGAPVAPAVQIGGGVWQRNFSSAKGTTVATYDQNTKKGTVWWAGEPAPAPTPAPPPPPAPTPPPAYCTAPMHDTGLANADLGNAQAVASFGECCERCHGRKGCVAWAWHAEQGGACHLHTAQASLHPKPTGCVSGYINATLQARA